MQGQQILAVVLVAAFATLNRDATILLFFVLPMPARWFLWLEIVFGFLGFLGTHDLPGFLGICAAVGITYGALYPARAAARPAREPAPPPAVVAAPAARPPAAQAGDTGGPR